MPFEQLVPRPLMATAVQRYAPIAPGVYGISNAREWIYIGETDNIQGALLTHLQDPLTIIIVLLLTSSSYILLRLSISSINSR